MARYIDAEALLTDEMTHTLPPIGCGRSNGRVVVFVDDIENTPTADVVQKSEVAELKAIIADHKANEERWQELYADTVDKWEKAYEELEIKLENAKVEVAREIFEEIEKTIRGALVLVGFSYKHNPKEIQCKKECYEDFLGYIAELKKKYTEEKE